VLNIDIDEDGVINLSGRFDASQVDKARETFETITNSCTVNFADLEYISSAGIGVLLGAYSRLHKSNKVLKLINLNKNIKNIFHYAGLSKLFEFE
jgi:anti-anti-sigma factor